MRYMPCFELRERTFVKEPEYRALEQIVAEAEAAGTPVVAIGPAGILEIQPPWPVNVVPGAPVMEGSAGPGKPWFRAMGDRCFIRARTNTLRRMPLVMLKLD